MTWEFEERLSSSMHRLGDQRTTEILREYFASPIDFRVDFSPRSRAYAHDLEVVAFGEKYLMEEKRRQKDFGDELLEDVSNNKTGRLGWTWNSSTVHFVLFVYPHRWTIWPGFALEQAWRTNRHDWAEVYGYRYAENRGYRTVNVAVPTEILKSAVSGHGAPICVHCGNNVGVFRSECRVCGVVSCCAISDGYWVCERCTARVEVKQS